jgi:hypothetical protein
MTAETRFYVELPADEYGNHAYPAAVIEGRVTDNDIGRVMLIAAPPELVGYSGYRLNAYGGWAEAAGPARLITRAEWLALVASVTESPKEAQS